jgi:predicted DNA-binding transcriptional regulator YafY
VTRSLKIMRRQWEMLRTLAQTRHGRTIAELEAASGVTRATVYRDLAFLEQVGLPLVSEGSGDGVRHRLLGQVELPPLTLNPLQIAALHLARAELEPLAGTGLVTELDALLAKVSAGGRGKPSDSDHTLVVTKAATSRPRILKVLQAGLDSKRRVRIEYRARTRGGAAEPVHVEPLLIRLTGGDPYLRAYCTERNDERTYKIARISRADLTTQACTHRRTLAVADAHDHALKAWSGDPETVRVRLDASVAWLAPEYPLPAQRLLPQPDGSVVIEAEVAGLVETCRWILSWGGAAEALYPPALREATRSELAQALAKYAKIQAKRKS